MKIENKEIILFDFDGTIANSLDYTIKQIHEFSQKQKINLTQEEIKFLIRNKPLKEIFKTFKINKIKLFFTLILIKKNIKKNINKIKPFPHVEETLKYLKNNEYKLGIITSNDKKIVIKFLKNNNLENFFEHFIFKATIFSKEKAINKYLKKYNLKKELSIYIGDEVRDLKSCEKININCIGVTYGFNSKKLLKKEKNLLLIDSFKEIKEIF